MEPRIVGSSSSSSLDKKGLLEYVRKSTPPPFLMKTYMLIDDPATDNVISWNADGTGFVVWQTAEFSRDLLPTLFKHSNFSSFVRQLNTYGFRKVATSRWEFCNEKFRRGERDLLCNIRRRKAWANTRHQSATPQESSDEDQRSSSSTSSLSEYNTLLDENKRLKKENGDLNFELSSIKSKCKDLLHLVAMYANNMEEDHIHKEGDGDDDDDHHIQRRPLMLFGVRLEVEVEKERKRKRAEIISQGASILLSQSCK